MVAAIRVLSEILAQHYVTAMWLGALDENVLTVGREVRAEMDALGRDSASERGIGACDQELINKLPGIKAKQSRGSGPSVLSVLHSYGFLRTVLTLRTMAAAGWSCSMVNGDRSTGHC